MADVFLSYARADTDKALAIKDALEALGLSVFFDTEGLDSGDVFPDVLDHEVKTAGAVVGVWSAHALTRPWVKIECDIGRARGVLVPVQVEPIADLDKPAAFWNIQFNDLSEFDGRADHPEWTRFLRALERTLKKKIRVPDAPDKSSMPPETAVEARAAPPSETEVRAEPEMDQAMSQAGNAAPQAHRRGYGVLLVSVLVMLVLWGAIYLQHLPSAGSGETLSDSRPLYWTGVVMLGTTAGASLGALIPAWFMKLRMLLSCVIGAIVGAATQLVFLVSELPYFIDSSGEAFALNRLEDVLCGFLPALVIVGVIGAVWRKALSRDLT